MTNHEKNTDKKSSPRASSLFFRSVRVFFNTLACAMILCALLLATGHLSHQDADKILSAISSFSLSPEAQFDSKAFTRDFLEKHEKKIARTEREDEASVRRAADSLDRYFAQKQENISLLVEDILSLGNKAKALWYLSKDKLTGSHETEAFLEGLFTAHLGSVDEVRAAQDEAIEGLKYALLENHNTLMPELEAALALEEKALGFHGVNAALLSREFHAQFDAQLKQALTISIATTLSVELLALAIDELVFATAVRAVAARLGSMAAAYAASLGVEAGILGSGAALSTFTAGLSLFVGIGSALVIDFVANKISGNKIERELTQVFGEWRSSTVASFRQGAMQGLAKLHETRRIALHDALLDTVAELGE